METVNWSAVQIDVILVELDRHSPPKNRKVRLVLSQHDYVECAWGSVPRNALFVSRRSPYNCKSVGEQQCICSYEDCDSCRPANAPPKWYGPPSPRQTAHRTQEDAGKRVGEVGPIGRSRVLSGVGALKGRAEDRVVVARKQRLDEYKRPRRHGNNSRLP